MEEGGGADLNLLPRPQVQLLSWHGWPCYLSTFPGSGGAPEERGLQAKSGILTLTNHGIYPSVWM